MANIISDHLKYDDEMHQHFKHPQLDICLNLIKLLIEMY